MCRAMDSSKDWISIINSPLPNSQSPVTPFTGACDFIIHREIICNGVIPRVIPASTFSSLPFSQAYIFIRVLYSKFCGGIDGYYLATQWHYDPSHIAHQHHDKDQSQRGVLKIISSAKRSRCISYYGRTISLNDGEYNPFIRIHLSIFSTDIGRKNKTCNSSQPH